MQLSKLEVDKKEGKLSLDHLKRKNKPTAPTLKEDLQKEMMQMPS